MKPRRIITAIATAAGLAGATSVHAQAPPGPLAIGATAPRPDAVDHTGAPIDWEALFKNRFALVYFYPKADTPGCTKQACSLRDEFAALTAKGIAVVGVSGDRPASQQKFRDKYRLPFALVADTEHKMMDAYGVPHLGAFATRQAFLFENGKLIWRDLKAATDRQAADVLAAVAGR